MSKRGWFLFIALGLIWGTPYLFIRIAVEDISPAAVVFGRTLIGAVLLLPLAWRKDALGVLKSHWKWITVFAIIEMALPFGALGVAEQKISSSLAGLLIAAVPLANAVFLKLANHGDGWDVRRAVGLAIGLGGVTALVGLDVRADTWWAIAITMLAVLGYASGPVVIDLKLSELPALAVIAWGQAIAAAIYAPVVLWEWTQDRVFLVPDVSTQALLSVVALGVFCTALAFVGLFALIDEVGPSRTTIITFINPAVAVVLGIVLLDEPLTTGLLVGFPLVLIGSVIATRKSATK